MTLVETILKVIIWIIYFIFLHYAVYWLSLLFEPIPSTRRKLLKQFPSVTIAIPLYNEEGTIEGTIKSIYRLNYPKDKLRVVCINDGSTDGSRATLQRLQNTYGFEIIHQRNHGKYYALNKVLATTKTDFFACLDADSYVSPASLQQLLADFDSPQVAAVMPIMTIHEPKNVLMRWQQIEYMTSIFLKVMMQKKNCISVTPGPFTVFRTEIIRKVGGYRKAHFTEDIEMALRLQTHNYVLRQSMSAFISTKAPDTWRAYYRQRIRWYTGTFLNAKDYVGKLNPMKYGEMGLLQVPMLLTGGLLTVLAILSIAALKSKQWMTWLHHLALTNFDIITLIRTAKFTFDPYSADFFILFCSAMLVLLAIVLMHISSKCNKITFNRHLT
ncbi:MAG: glycosyltransferase, partial [Nanoarchaeota archaeon]